MQTVYFGEEKFLTPSWDEMGNLCFKLAKKILKKEKSFDRLVALAKGGLTWSRTLLDYLDIKELSSFQVKFYQDIAKKSERPVIVQSLPVSVQNQKILLFDDVSDSGETLKVASEYLKLCGAAQVTAATLFIKSWTKILPEFYAKKTDAWIIFPHERREMIELLSKRWQKQKINKKKIIERLVKIGLPKKEVLYFNSLQNL